MAEPTRGARCYTRAAKNAQYLRQIAPDVFGKDPTAEAFGTGVPLDVLQRLHQLTPDSPLLKNHKKVARFLAEHPMPQPGRFVR